MDNRNNEEMNPEMNENVDADRYRVVLCGANA